MNLMRFSARSSERMILSAIAGAAGGVAHALIAASSAAGARPAPAHWPGPSSRRVASASAGARPDRDVKWARGTALSLPRPQTLVLPLRAFGRSTTGPAVALTDDIALIANAMVGLPHLCINIPIVIACLAYTGWLAPRSMACGVVFAALAIGAYAIVSARGMKSLRRARERQALLVGHFRTLIGGFGAQGPPRGPGGVPRRVARADWPRAH
jgi:putative ATP-binding cassette transporter